MSSTSVQTTPVSASDKAAAWAAAVDDTLNASKRVVVLYKKAESAAGPVSVRALTGVVAMGAAVYAASKGYGAIDGLVPAAAGDGVRNFAFITGSLAAAAPAVTAYASSITKDGLIRGALEGAAFITLPFFVGQILARGIDIGPGWGNALAFLMGIGGLIGYVAGQTNRFEENQKK